MRKAYEDPEKHLQRHMGQAADRYVSGLQRAGLKPNQKLTKAVAERAYEQARESYTREAEETLENNVQVILQEHRRNMNEIKRGGAKLRLWTCPPAALMLGGVAWYNYTFHPGPEGMLVAAMYACGALAFLGMLIGGAIFDRPK